MAKYAYPNNYPYPNNTSLDHASHATYKYYFPFNLVSIFGPNPTNFHHP
jgi:hypothetical protein